MEIGATGVYFDGIMLNGTIIAAIGLIKQKNWPMIVAQSKMLRNKKKKKKKKGRRMEKRKMKKNRKKKEREKITQKI